MPLCDCMKLEWLFQNSPFTGADYFSLCLLPKSLWLSCCSLTPVGSSAPSNCTFLQSAHLGRIRMIKVQELLGWNKDRLLGEANATHSHKEEPGIHLLLPISRQIFSHLQESRDHPPGGFMGRQTPSLKMYSSSFFTPIFVAKHDVIWCGISLRVRVLCTPTPGWQGSRSSWSILRSVSQLKLWLMYYYYFFSS